MCSKSNIRGEPRIQNSIARLRLKNEFGFNKSNDSFDCCTHQIWGPEIKARPRNRFRSTSLRTASLNRISWALASFSGCVFSASLLCRRTLLWLLYPIIDGMALGKNNTLISNVLDFRVSITVLRFSSLPS